MATILCIDFPHAGLWDHGVWETLLDAADCLSPLLDDDRPGRLYAQMRGIPGTPQQWMQIARNLCAAHGVRAHIGIGANRFVASVVARYDDGACWSAEQSAQLLAPVSLAALEIDAASIERLGLLGIQTLGELAALPHGPFVRRFGSMATVWHERARGIDLRPLRPRARRCSIEAALLGEGSVTTHEQVLFALRTLIAQVVLDCESSGLRVGSLQIDFECENGDAEGIQIALAAPTSDARTLFDVTRARLEGHIFEAPICALRLRGKELEEGGGNMVLFADESHDAHALAATLGRLHARTGTPVQRARVRKAHVCEQRFYYDVFPAVLPKERNLKIISSEHLVPQLRLLTVREIQVNIARGVPVALDGRRICGIAGPWRVDDSWNDEPLLRDEYDVHVEDGALVRIYRRGEHWYLRGTYD